MGFKVLCGLGDYEEGAHLMAKADLSSSQLSLDQETKCEQLVSIAEAYLGEIHILYLSSYNCYLSCRPYCGKL